jgi:UDP-N-acetylmuramoyl-tripeptide--D-alanyl-D-alanine ligase
MESLYALFQDFPRISTDTRSIEKDSLFFALRGDRFDGNKYAAEALAKGAAYAIVDDGDVKDGPRYIVVPNVLDSLQQLARIRRQHLNVPVLALTGSNGKTTTKELTRDVLAQKYRVHATKGNLNNHIGVPLTILSAPAETEFLLVEMGANHQGEIDALCMIAQPMYGMITNIGKAHLEGFGGVEGIKKGKSELYRYVADHGGFIFINTDDEVLTNLLPDGIGKLSYSPSRSLILRGSDPTISFEYNQQLVHTHLYGAYNIPNIGFAIAAGEYFGVEKSKIALAIAAYTPENNRSQLTEWGTNSLILDAYNANPSSMKASLESLAKMPAQKKVAVLGDMLELGDYTIGEHRAIIQLAEELGLQHVLFVGPHFCEAGKGLPGHFFDNLTTASQYFHGQNYSDALILLKGSRGMAIEKMLAGSV